MKFTLLLFALLFPVSLFAQPDTEVFLFDLEYKNGTYSISNPLNVSNNPGYDSQPSFLPDGSGILFSSTRNNQTDVLHYDISSGEKKWLSDSEGGEYSPTVMPDGNHFSTIRLKPNGEQLLWKYPLDGSGNPEVIVPEVVIGYHTWFSKYWLFSFVLANDQLPSTLQAHNLVSNENIILAKTPGRSLHRIPDSNSISYVDKTDANIWIVKAYEPFANTTESIIATLKGSEDMAWTTDGTILMGSDTALYSYKSKEDVTWKKIADLNKYGLTGITRISVSPNNDKVAIVVNK